MLNKANNISNHTKKRNVRDKMEDIESLINQMKRLYIIDKSIRFNTPEYTKFHTELLDFIYANHFETTDEWKRISENLVYTSSQYMVTHEADIILVQLELLRRKMLERKYLPGWEFVHPEIIKVSQKLYFDGHFANAVCDAFIEINDRIKRIFKMFRPGEKIPDGVAAIQTVFSPNAPILEICDRSSETGRNIQKGYMEMMTGAMSALRNPKAHENIFTTADDAMRRLIFASMLMYKIDEAMENANACASQEENVNA